MTAGYFIRNDGDRYALVRQDEAYREEIVIDGLPYERAAKLYWRYVREWLKERTKSERQPEPALFELKDDARPSSQRKAGGRFSEPTLFEL